MSKSELSKGRTPVVDDLLAKLVESRGADWTGLFTELLEKHLIVYFSRLNIEEEMRIKLSDVAVNLWVYECKSIKADLNRRLVIKSFKSSRLLTCRMWESHAFRNFVERRERLTLPELRAHYLFMQHPNRMCLPEPASGGGVDETESVLAQFAESANELISKVGFNLQATFQTLVRIDKKLEGAA